MSYMMYISVHETYVTLSVSMKKGFSNFRVTVFNKTVDGVSS